MVKHTSMKIKADNKEDNVSVQENGTKIKAVRKYAFRLSSKSFFLTYPKCKMSKENAMEKLKLKKPATYICVSQEKHEDGTDHLHALFTAKDKLVTTNVKYFDLSDDEEDGSTKIYHGNYQGARDNVDIQKYIQKDNNFIEFGEFQSNKQDAVQERRLHNELLLNNNLPDLVASGQLALSQYKWVKESIECYRRDIQSPNDPKNKVVYWIYGKPGSGKSTYAFDNFPNAFDKPQNKWWDNYEGQDTVILDDLTKEGAKCLTYHLRRWLDKRAFPAEIKGSLQKSVCFSKFIITSNYLPKDIWTDDPETVEAIERRCEMKTMFEYKLVDYPLKMQSFIEFAEKKEIQRKPKIELINERNENKLNFGGQSEIIIKHNSS